MTNEPIKATPHPMWATVEEAVNEARALLLRTKASVHADETLSDESRSMLLGRLWVSLTRLDRGDAIFDASAVDKVLCDGGIDFAKPWEYEEGAATIIVRPLRPDGSAPLTEDARATLDLWKEIEDAMAVSKEALLQVQAKVKESTTLSTDERDMMLGRIWMYLDDFAREQRSS